MNLLTINEIAQKLDEWAKRREHKLPEHLGHISFYGSLLKALGNLPDLVFTWLQSRMPEQLNSIQKDFDDLYKKAKGVDHERSESGGEANILKCQAQAAAKKLAKKLWLLEDIDKSCSKQTEIKKESAETEQKATINVNISGDVQAENLQIGHDATIKKGVMAGEKKKGILRRIPYWIYILISFLAALLTLGWLEPIKEFINKILWPK
jgi:hypothetical protein